MNEDRQALGPMSQEIMKQYHKDHAHGEVAEQKQKKLLSMVNRQAEDEGLWFVAETAAEAYLQQELRLLHAVIEEVYFEKKHCKFHMAYIDGCAACKWANETAFI